MKPYLILPVLRFGVRLGAVSVVAAVLWSQAVWGQTIPNPSFEADTFTVFPGYIRDNGPITGWTGTPPERVGLNPGGGTPFANNGTIPDGDNVAFIQSNASDPSTLSTLSTTISGLVPGTTYKVTFRANVRGNRTPPNQPHAKVYIDNMSVMLPGAPGMPPDGFTVAEVGGTAPYWYAAFEFTAMAESQTLSIVNDVTGDQTLLVDDFRIAPSSGRWTVEQWVTDEDSGVDPSYFYTHAYNLGSGANLTINNVNFTGVAGAAPAVPGKFSTTYFAKNPVSDPGALVFGNSATMAAQFVYGGDVPAGSPQSITLEGLTPGTEYVMTVFSVAWENPSEESRWATLSVGDDYLTVNQDQFGDHAGLRFSYRYTADASGTVTMQFAPFIPKNTSIHVYGFANREAESRFVGPEIVVEPRDFTVSPGVPVTFAVNASGIPLPSYQWRFNGQDLPGEVNATCTLPAASAADAGLYDVVVANLVGTVTSRVARLTVGNINIANASFEDDDFWVWPGYSPANGAITGWNAEGNHGLNPVSGEPPSNASPFADNGLIPHGEQVAFMQGAGALSQSLTGFTVGGEYYLHYHENARSHVTVPGVAVKIGDAVIVPERLVPPVGGSRPYYEIFSAMFVAPAANLDLAFIKSNPQGGDSTALIDNVAIIAVPPGTPPMVGMPPQPSRAAVGQSASFSAVAQGSSPLHYQWCFNGQPLPGATDTSLLLPMVSLTDEGDYTLVVTNSAGAATSSPAPLFLLEPIALLRNTGIGSDGLPQANGAISPFWTLMENPDSEASTVWVANDNVFPISTGDWMASTADSKWVSPRAAAGDANIAGGTYRYRITFDLAGRDPDTVLIEGRWATDDNGAAVLVNGEPVSVSLSSGFKDWTKFVITSETATFQTGENTLDFDVRNQAAGPTGLRVEFTATSARTVGEVPPAIVIQPEGKVAVEGDTVTLAVSATGTLPISYQWQKDAVDLSGKTNATLVLADVTEETSGRYRVRVSNPWGSVVSDDALVQVAYRPLPGFFGTGVDHDGTLLGDGDTDPHYILAESADANFPGPEAVCVTNVWPIGDAWMPNGPRSRWIAPSANQRQDVDPSAGNLPGQYTYQTTFDLTGYDPDKIRVVLGIAVDNEVADVLLNGVSTGIIAAGFGGLAEFTLTSGFVAGENTLDFIVKNSLTGGTNPDTPNPAGLRVDMRGLLNIAPVGPSVTLHVEVDAGTVSVSWSPVSSGQKLEWAPTVTGPWTEIESPPHPYTAPVTEAARFYRIKQ
jgi:hypothetical protein